MIVIKFGGTSVGDDSRVSNAIEIVADARERSPVVVVSALSGVTNDLVAATRSAAEGDFEAAAQTVARIRERHEEVALRLVKQKSDYLESFLAQLGRHTDQIVDILKGIALVGDVSLRANDKIVAIGEKLSSVLFAYAMRLKTLPGVHIDSERVVVTDERFGEAVPLLEETRRSAREVLMPELERKHIPVMGGFIGRSSSGATTTLGRGGSDYSASIVGAALDAEEIQIWTDVDGMMTFDPRVIPNARIVEEIAYVEAAELAWFGAKVLHPKTIAPAVAQQIPIRVLNTHNRTSPGTLITESGSAKRGPQAIAVKHGIVIIHLTSSQMLGAHGFLARIFEVFDRLEVPVDLITTSEVSVSLTIDQNRGISRLVRELEPFAGVRVDEEQSIIALVGRDLMHDTTTGATILTALAGTSISMMSLGSSGLNLSIVVPRASADAAVQSIHRALFEHQSEVIV
ncbi:MAG TPA: lysine-sensitive aspartokinase 3 [Thermoanaerobaculia bacterium]|nr:lysine-sensitive aspartokinase 3 [Thermoanaerobaculia bacterium]